MARRTATQITEKDFQQQIIDLAHMYQWLVYHTYDSRKSAPGYPDLTFCHPKRGEFFIAEVKGLKGILSTEQREWIAALTFAGIEVYVWRPEDWDAIAKRLLPKGVTTQ